jgi:hypothetical protein
MKYFLFVIGCFSSKLEMFDFECFMIVREQELVGNALCLGMFCRSISVSPKIFT